MNESSKPLAHPTTINDWLTRATTRLKEAGIASSRLDGELILAHVLKKDRTWLAAHPDEELTDPHLVHRANTMLTKRVHRLPLAYLTGSKEFYGRDFLVNEHVLIPRPETETMIEIIKRLRTRTHATLLDIGTGSGCIAITAKLELPDVRVTASDISSEAIDIASQNALRLRADISFVKSDLLAQVDSNFDLIVSNPPYVDPEWERSPETDFEPSLALFADENGLAIIHRLIEQAAPRLNPTGYLLIEADPEQHDDIEKTGASYGLRLVETGGYIVALCKD